MFAAYLKYAEHLKLKSELLDASDGHITAKFTGAGVWDAFKNEAGKHVIQRCPPTERSGRRHTSVVAVAVLSLPPDKGYKPLPEDELDIKTQNGHGPGGQHQNKTQSAVRMVVHKPTGLQVFINGRDQHGNRAEALRILTARVNEYKLN